ncbi:MAG: DUF2079 domain-containing protein [Bacilli bacterium]|nr:DUF2079 domain-containing protein [Bacilli bacterium]
MDKLKKIIKIIKKQNAFSLITKLLISFISVSLVEILFSKNNFNTSAFFNSISFLPHFLIIILLFLLLCLFSKNKLYKNWESYILICSCLSLFIVTNTMVQNFYYALVSSIIMGALVFYYNNKLKSFFIKKNITIIICTSLGILFVGFISSLTILYYLSYLAPSYDFGIFSQMFHYMNETLIPYTTVERSNLLSHFAVHFSPILYLFLPFYLIFSNPVTLLIMQAIVIALGLIPIYKLCKHYKYNDKIIIALSIIYILMPALIGGNFYYFHENKILAVLLLYLFYFIEKGNSKLTALFVLLVMLVKEDAAVYIGFIGLYLLFSKRKNINGWHLIIASVIYFSLVTTLMQIYGEGIMAYRYENFLFNGENNLISVIINIIKNPAYLFYQLLNVEKLNFLIYMFVPMALLPLAIKKPSGIILLLPLVLINLMTNYGYQYNIGFQYTYGSIAFLFYLAIINIKNLPKKLVKKLLICGVSSSLIFFSATHFPKTTIIKTYINNIEQTKIINEGLNLIPDNKSVKATTFFVANLWYVDELYDYDYTNKKTDYIVLDLRYNKEKYNLSSFKTNKYKEIYYFDDIIAIYKFKKSN